MRPLTDRQRSILEFIRTATHERGVPPSIREIGAAFGIRSPNGVVCHLKALERRGAIVRQRYGSRAISLPVARIEFRGEIS